MRKQSWLVLTTLATNAALASAQLPLVPHASTLVREPAPCLAAAAHYHAVNPWLLRAILKVESDFKADAVNRNANGTVDVGMAQINSIHFPELARWGVTPIRLLDGCTATYVAAWHLARQIRRHGNSWYGAASYHSTSPCQNSRYAGLLWNTLLSWNAVTGARLPVTSLKACTVPAPAASRSAALASAAASAPALAFDEAP
ncbi:MAG TPA: lytic transglycosylase domain-containing protein [Ramlibacter sp.]|jgi:soluble lytic murein transglycosylase-like protein|nr:lytic transglycosylase domain-containing protein [Ramlibacter sp.]